MNRNLSKVIELDEEEIRMLSNLLIRFTYKYPEKKEEIKKLVVQLLHMHLDKNLIIP